MYLILIHPSVKESTSNTILYRTKQLETGISDINTLLKSTYLKTVQKGPDVSVSGNAATSFNMSITEFTVTEDRDGSKTITPPVPTGASKKLRKAITNLVVFEEDLVAPTVAYQK